MNKAKYRLYILIALISIVVYGPLIFKGGFGPMDDLPYIEKSLGKSNVLQLTIDRMIYDID